MGEVAGLVLSLGLAISGGTSNDQVMHDRYIDGARHAFDAGYIQSGLKPVVDKRMADLERKYVPKEVEKYGSIVAIVAKVIAQRELSLTWSF